jgi:cell division protein FtsW (lipid II flippase)
MSSSLTISGYLLYQYRINRRMQIDDLPIEPLPLMTISLGVISLILAHCYYWEVHTAN